MSSLSFLNAPRRSRRYTWMPSFAINNIAHPGSGAGLWGTQLHTVSCPDDFFAVRVGFIQMTPNTYIVPAVTAVGSSTRNDLVNPTGGAAPVRLTFLHAGADSEDIVTAADAPTTIVVMGNTPDQSTGETFVPKWTWTDWCRCPSAGADPVTGMRTLMIRHTVTLNDSSPVTFINGTIREWSGDLAINHGYDAFVGGFNNGSDLTLFERVSRQLAETNTLVNGSFIAAVQLLTANDVLQVHSAGDSHASGASTAAQINSFLPQTIASLGARRTGVYPMGFSTTSIAGAESRLFFPSCRTFLPYLNGGVLVLPGWTYNDVGNEPADAPACELFFARLTQMIDIARRDGFVPIVMTPFPRDRDCMGPVQLANWKSLYRRVLNMRKTGTIVVDATTAMGNRTALWGLDGCYAPGLSTDNKHPSDAGHARIVAPLAAALAHIGALDMFDGQVQRRPEAEPNGMPEPQPENDDEATGDPSG